MFFIYSAPISNSEVLQQRVENASQEIRVRTHMRRGVESCLEMDGSGKENLL
jgi:hypothetical protein